MTQCRISTTTQKGASPAKGGYLHLFALSPNFSPRAGSHFYLKTPPILTFFLTLNFNLFIFQKYHDTFMGCC